MMKLNFDYGKNGFYIESASLEDGLVGVYNAIGDLPYALLGIDAMKIRTELQKSAANDFSGMLQQVKVGEIVKNAGGSEFMHLCEPIIFDEIVKRFFGDAVPKKSISLSAPQLKGKMVFINDSKDWVIVKKATVGSDTTAREAAAFLFGVKAAVYSKYLSIRCPQRSADSAMMAKVLKGKRKSLGALNDAYNASGGRLCAFLEGAALLGYAPTPSQDTIKEAFPELKLPGMRGRKPKG